MARKRVPNTRLRALIEETDWTQAGLARAVNAVGAELGLDLHYDRSTVAHWLTGSSPGPRVLPLVCEALRRRTGRLITPEQAGFVSSTPAVSSRRAEGAGHHLDGLLHEVSATLPYRPADARSGAPTLAMAGEPATVSAAETGLAGGPRSAVRFFTEVLQTQGGGFARATLSTYLAEALTGQLREATGKAQRELAGEAARLTLLLGRMYADDLQHGAAQRCLLTARDLAVTAGRREVAVIAVRTLSTQAQGLGHLRIADGAARAATRAARAAPPAVQAFTQAQLAVTTAGRGERTEALRALSLAETAVEHAEDGGRHPFASYGRGDFEFQRAETMLALGDPTEAVRVLELALAARAADDRRGLVLTRLRLASVLLSLGRVDETRGHELALREEFPGLRSAAAERSLDSLRRSLFQVGTRARSGRVGGSR
ncbi:hypothetical protein [Streptomyces prunicolor]